MTLSLARVLYRGLLRTSRRLDEQIHRHGSVDLFPEARPLLGKNTAPPQGCGRVSTHPLRDPLTFPRPSHLRAQTETLKLRELLPGYKAALALGARAALDRLVGDAFRGAARDADEVNRRLDDAVAAYAMLRRRVQLLEGMASEPASDTLTDGVRVQVRSALVPEMSSPLDSTFTFSYTVTITNESADEPVQVVSRHWEIQDEEGHVEEVRGTGLVGFQPVLEKGGEFEYTSRAPLRRLKGSMRGTLTAVGQTSGRLLELGVGAFALTPPKATPTTETKTGRVRGRRVDRSARGVREASARAE